MWDRPACRWSVVQAGVAATDRGPMDTSTPGRRVGAGGASCSNLSTRLWSAAPNEGKAWNDDSHAGRGLSRQPRQNRKRVSPPGSVPRTTVAERGSMRYTFHGGGPCDGALNGAVMPDPLS